MDIDSYLQSLGNLARAVDPADIEGFVKVIQMGTRVWIVGNGGSAANADHAANDLIKAAGVPAVACTAPAPLTAYANDRMYRDCFSGPLEVLMEPGDVLLALTVSGTSQNVIETASVAVGNGSPILLLTGPATEDNALLRDMALVTISVPDADFGLVETVHQGILHLVVEILKEENNG